MDTKSSKCVHLVEGGTNGSQDVNMAPMGKTSLGRVIHARKRQKTSFTNLETHGDGSGYLACDTCSSGVPEEIVPAGIVPIGNILVGNNIGFQTRTKGSSQSRARAGGGDALGEARLARPLVGHAVAAPVAGVRGLPTQDAWSALRWGRGWRSQRRAAAWLGARGPLCPPWGWRVWCSQCCP